MPDGSLPIYETNIWDRMSREEKDAIRIQLQGWNLSQILHGEQAAMVCASQLLEAEADLTIRLCVASQVVDEARHTEVYAKLVKENFEKIHPLSKGLRSLLKNIFDDCRPDMKSIGMQILIEGIAVAFFSTIKSYSTDPFVKKLMNYVLKDENRHYSIGLVYLKEKIPHLTEAEKEERQEFVAEACFSLQDHLVGTELWDHLGLRKNIRTEIGHSSSVVNMKRTLFRRIVPSIREIGLLGSKTIRAFEKIGIVDPQYQVGSSQ
jgi:hypothetical protein